MIGDIYSYRLIDICQITNYIITLLRFCDALGGAVVGCEPKFEMTSEILWVTSSQIRSSLDIVIFRFLTSEDRIRSSEDRIWDDVTQRISDVISNFGSHPTTAPPSASQNLKRVIHCNIKIWQMIKVYIKFMNS